MSLRALTPILMNTDEWNVAIEDAVSQPPPVIDAETYLNRKWGTSSSPVLLGCADKKDYVIKGKQAGRILVNDHLVGRLGALISAPVGTVCLVNVQQGRAPGSGRASTSDEFIQAVRTRDGSHGRSRRAGRG